MRGKSFYADTIGARTPGQYAFLSLLIIEKRVLKGKPYQVAGILCQDESLLYGRKRPESGIRSVRGPVAGSAPTHSPRRVSRSLRNSSLFSLKRRASWKYGRAAKAPR